MDINDIYEIVKYALKKNNNGSVTPISFNRVVNLAQIEYAAWLCGNMQGYQPGHPMPKVEFGNNRTSRQRLTPVIYGYTLHIDATTGIAPYPGDYIQTDSMYSIYGVNRVRYVQQNQLDSVYNSAIEPIATNPIYLIKDVGFQFLPITQWQAKLSYVRNPPPMEWAYDLDIHGRPTYNPITSKQPVWDEASLMDIIVRALVLVGVNLQVGAVIQYAQEIKNSGQ